MASSSNTSAPLPRRKRAHARVKDRGCPSDQLIRNIWVGVWEQREQLFAIRPRDFTVIVIGLDRGHSLVNCYRNPGEVRAAIPHHDRLVGLPRTPFVGELGYADIIAVLQSLRKWFSRAERQIATDLETYLDYKRGTARQHRGASQPL